MEQPGGGFQQMEVVAVDRELIHKNLVAEYEKIIPKVTYRFGDKTVDEFGISECTICLEKFRDGEKLSKLPTCRHFFHTECILRWFMGEQQRESQKCPMCNLEVTVAAIKLANKQNLIDSPGIFSSLKIFKRDPSPLPQIPPSNHQNSQPQNYGG